MLDSDEAIAVVGLAAKVPGARDVEEYWLNLLLGRESVSALTDQQPRAQIGLLLEVAHCAIENAGYDPAKLTDGVGVFAAADLPHHTPYPEIGNSSSTDSVTLDRSDHVTTTGWSKPHWPGPGGTVLDWCSSTLVALHRAGQSLRAGDCRTALVGGVATGGVPGGGACAVLVKRLSDAIADHNHVSAVIRGIALDNDGADPAGVPSESARTAVITEAMTSADQRVGDLGRVAGLFGFIKVALALDREQLPPALTFAAPGLRLNIESTPFRVHDHLAPWPRDPQRPRRASVTSLSTDGPNVHVVLEEGPVQDYAAHAEEPRVVVWSGRTVAAERAARHRLAQFFNRRGEEVFSDAVATLQHGRAGHPVRAAAVCTSAYDATAVLSTPDTDRVVTHGEQVREPRPVSLLFAGEGWQHVGMARELYRSVPVFAHALDGWLDRLESADLPIRDCWLGTADGLDVNDRAFAQPLLFAVEAALAQLWQEAGIRPAALFGHGIGEFVAATTAGVFAPADAAALVLAGARAGRSRTPGAAMPDEPATVFAKAFSGIATRAPAVPVYSATTGRQLTPAEAGDPSYWAGRLVHPVRLADTELGLLPATRVDALLDAGETILVEAGPARVLSEPARRHPPVRPGHVGAVPTLSQHGGDEVADLVAMLTAAAHLWTEGYDIAWERLGQTPLRHRVPMPGHPYQRPRFWTDPPARSAGPATVADGPGAAPTAHAGPAATFPTVLGAPSPAAPTRPADTRNTARSGWFDVLTPDRPGPMVVAIPYAGGSGRALRPVHRYLPQDCGLALVDLPGHGRRMGEAYRCDPDAVVAELFAALPALPATRLVLLGYSLGGWLAYELAARLTEAGTPPEGLVICGTRAPQTGIGRPPVAHLPSGEPFVRAAVDMGLAAREMLELPALAESFAPALQADLSIVESFRYRRRPPLPVPVCIVGFRADWLAPEPALRPWDRLFRRPPLHLRTDGGHLAVHEREREFGEAVGAGLEHVLGLGRVSPNRSTVRATSTSPR